MSISGEHCTWLFFPSLLLGKGKNGHWHFGFLVFHFSDQCLHLLTSFFTGKNNTMIWWSIHAERRRGFFELLVSELCCKTCQSLWEKMLFSVYYRFSLILNELEKNTTILCALLGLFIVFWNYSALNWSLRSITAFKKMLLSLYCNECVVALTEFCYLT